MPDSSERFSGVHPFRDDKNLVCFFDGENIAPRMDVVRESIHYVRDNWNDRDWFCSMLDKLYKEYTLPINEKILLQKNWIDEQNVPEMNHINFDLIKYYTDKDGYQFLKQMNDAFREINLNKEKCNLATFLVELFNIELYNFRSIIKSADNFEGTVYRGFSPKSSDAEKVFEGILAKPINKRKIAIPLEFMSASLDKNVAINYASRNRTQIGQTPVLFEINVRNLDSKLLKTYHKFYKDSPVTSLCAVPIEMISSNPDDKEVLLRGAFFQVLDVRLEGGFVVVKTLMLNSNRDHIKTHKYKNTNAQKLFGSLVKQDKMRICKEISTNEKDRRTYAEAETLAKEETKKMIEISKK